MLRALIESLRAARREIQRMREKNEAKEASVCATCGEVLYGCDLYMLRNETWAEVCTKAKVSEDSLLCLMCAHLHADRMFRLDDFSPAPVNRKIRTVWWFATAPRSIGPARRT